VSGLECLSRLATASSPAAITGLFGYGPGPGVELIPYFLGLLGWVALALAGIFAAPLSALLRLLRRRPQEKPAPPPTANPTAATVADMNPSPSGSAPEARGERHDAI